MRSLHRPSPLPDPKQTKPEVLLELDYYSEGPIVNQSGEVFFTDLQGQCIRKYQNGQSEVWGKGQRPNGQAVMENGCHLVCDSQSAAVFKYSHQGKFLGKASPDHIGNVRVRCPNDVAICPENGFYFTDSVREDGAVFFVGWNGETKVLATGVDFANGIVFHREKNILLVAESYKNRILKLDLDLSPKDNGFRSVFAELPFNDNPSLTGNLPDGMALDIDGRLWIAHYGMQAIQVLSENGELLATYDSGIPLTSNLCFHEEALLITGGFGEPGPGRLSRIKVGIKGYPLF